MSNEDQLFWKAVLTNQTLRSRFIRDLEIQSILDESMEEHFQRYKDEKILDGGINSWTHSRPSKARNHSELIG